MNTNRISFIDSLKGMTIILVVMGHIAEKAIGLSDTPFNEFYASFHMPMFIFLSGLFAYKSFSQWNFAEVATFFKKKVLRIIVPFVTIGGGYFLLSHLQKGCDLEEGFGGYWFLLALFYCMTVGAITNYLRVKVGQGRALVDTCIEVFAWGLICAGYYSHLFDVMPFYLYFVKMYPFFIMGTMCYSHKRILTAIVSNEWLLAASVVIFIASFFCPSLPVKVGGFFAIIILMNLFACYDKQVPAWLTTIGRYSLEIYVFHWFLIPQLSRCHNFFVGQTGETLDNGNFVIIFFISLAIALGIIAFCIAAGLIVKRSRILRAVLFGGY